MRVPNINQNVLALEEFQARMKTLTSVVIQEYRYSAFVYDADGNVLGGYLDLCVYEARDGLYGRYANTKGYLHS